MSRDDVECPYCGAGQDICHDDGYGYEEDMLHEQQCPECEKYFTFTTTIIFYYTSQKADCLNGGEHEMIDRPSTFYPDRKLCKNCEYEDKGEADKKQVVELASLMAEKPKKDESQIDLELERDIDKKADAEERDAKGDMYDKEKL